MVSRDFSCNFVPQRVRFICALLVWRKKKKQPVGKFAARDCNDVQSPHITHLKLQSNLIPSQ